MRVYEMTGWSRRALTTVRQLRRDCADCDRVLRTDVDLEDACETVYEGCGKEVGSVARYAVQI